MELLILILNKLEKPEEALEEFLEMGISGTTVIDNIGMAIIIDRTFPSWAGEFKALVWLRSELIR